MTNKTNNGPTTTSTSGQPEEGVQPKEGGNFVDRVSVDETFVEGASNVFFSNGNIFMTFYTYRAGHPNQAKADLVVSERLVIPLMGALGLQKRLSDLFGELEKNGTIQRQATEKSASEEAPATAN